MTWLLKNLVHILPGEDQLAKSLTGGIDAITFMSDKMNPIYMR